jgi:hypothetical protein
MNGDDRGQSLSSEPDHPRCSHLVNVNEVRPFALHDGFKCTKGFVRRRPEDLGNLMHWYLGKERRISIPTYYHGHAPRLGKRGDRASHNGLRSSGGFERLLDDENLHDPLPLP